MKERLDVLMVDRYLAPSREKAKALIMSGNVYVNGNKEIKAGQTFDPNVSIEVRGTGLKYVSRGGLKLEKAVKVWKLDFTGMTCIDIGSSTGGFTDCMLQNNALKVYAVDSGTNQLCWRLRNDDRVVVMENTNFRYATKELIGEEADFACADVSFISLEKILGPAAMLLKPESFMVCLIKPQFEAGRENVGKKGVVRDKKVHSEVVEKVIGYAQNAGFLVLALDYSPITGPNGNIEYLCLLQKTEKNSEKEFDIRALVEEAFAAHSMTSETCE